MSTTIRCGDHEGGTRLLTLDRPPANAINEELLADLAASLDAARDDDAVRSVVLTGAGRFFSGGFDFAAPRRDDEVAGDMYRLYRETHLRLLTFPKPTIAMLNGHATAGGLVLMLACDYRLGVEGDYKVGLNEVAVGASFPRAAFEIVKLRLPHSRATELILGAALYPAGQALRLGIVDELFAPDKFSETILRRAARLGSFPREAYAHAKANFVAEATARIQAETPEEALKTISVWLTPESRAARSKQRVRLGVGE
ncbi:MAG TPA: enoyl-CoA hydratase/isomerase family protein [Candidatus Acidoferrales bacterium]|nr:enoyl-CoA hydratase/isomerase family protein [Candidatus Acidoferrales bacterium]